MVWIGGGVGVFCEESVVDLGYVGGWNGEWDRGCGGDGDGDGYEVGWGDGVGSGVWGGGVWRFVCEFDWVGF